MNNIKFDVMNIVCPNCGDPNYMRHMSGKGIKEIDVKCFNCLRYFKSSELNKIVEKRYIPVEIANKIIETFWEISDTEWSVANDVRQKCFEMINKNSITLKDK